MNAPLSRIKQAWANPENTSNSRNRYLWGHEAGIRLADFAVGTCLDGHIDELAGRSVLLAVRDQVAAALALIELDGIASRIVLCPPDLGPEQLKSVAHTGLADAIVCDRDIPVAEIAGARTRIHCGSVISAIRSASTGDRATEWILLSSGTSTGNPKLVVHTLTSLTAPILPNNNPDPSIIWGTFYDIRRYGGLQIFLRAILGNGSLILSGPDESLAEHVARLQLHGVTHLTGTPSHWRRLLMSAEASRIAPRYIRLSGEIADQAILDMLETTYSPKSVAHAFASTEAGVAFEVSDKKAGFPVDFLGQHGQVELEVTEMSLRIRSDRVARGYLGEEAGSFCDAQGFVDTGDIVERRGDRFHFLGRRNGTINVGGLKVHPEEIEAVINGHPRVAMCSVKARRNPILGSVVSAEIVLKAHQPDDSLDGAKVEDEILILCQRSLQPHKVPATVRFVPSLNIAEAGKMSRHNA